MSGGTAHSGLWYLRPTIIVGLVCALMGILMLGMVSAQAPTPHPEPGPIPKPTANDPAPAPVAPDPCDKCKIDTDRIHFAGVDDDAPVRSEEQNKQEYEAYNEVLLQTRRFTLDELKACANKDLTFGDLLRPIRKDFQFKPVMFEGRLKRLVRLEPTRPLAAAGVQNLYEGWVFPRDGADPMCVLITELPEGLETSREYPNSIPVKVVGYSFKVIRYEAEEWDPKDSTRHRIRRAPLIMARSLILIPVAPADGGELWRNGFVPGILGLIGAISVVVLGLTLWFRRGDRRLRQELSEVRSRNPFDGA